MPRGFVCFALWLTSWISAWGPQVPIDAGVDVPIVDLGYAQYQGHYDAQTNITSYLGVRYAAPPVGECSLPVTAIPSCARPHLHDNLGKLRFQAPQPPVYESGVQLATQHPNTCYQGAPGSDLFTPPTSPFEYDEQSSLAPTSSKDCLFLNVFVPGSIPEPATDGLPVVVWIHGGGYTLGSATQYDGADLIAHSQKTIIVVVIQYRLGAFGFLSGNEVKAHGALNVGLLDQVFALKWVQYHIGSFGGDKARVTVWGESAGAGSILQHIVANGGNTQPPLFNAAIVSSPALVSQYYYNDRVPQSLYNRVVAQTKCASSADTCRCLQSVDAESLATANQDIARSVLYNTFAFVPVVDGTFIVERPTVTLARGRVNGHLLLAFSNEHEGNFFKHPNKTLPIAEYISSLFPDLTSLEVGEVAAVYEAHGSAREQASLVTGDSLLVCPAYYLLRAFAGRSWKGLFAIPPASHADDVPYYAPSVLRGNIRVPPYDNKEFSTAFTQSFMSIAKYKDVNVKFDPSNITPHWHRYWSGGTEMLFNRTEAGAPVVEPITTDPVLLQRCALWSSLTAATAQ